MDNVGDWLYIVFLIIAAVSGLFGSKDKKKKSRPDVLRQPEREIVPNDQPTEEKGFRDIPDSTVPQPSVKMSAIKEEPGLMPEDTFRDIEELKKAIICAEILNRKY
ncbi:hypothetical protein [Parabacteroides sp. ZJ-118]|uniref:hypothetical protein n=1 Tax=Parabacteroides sp. ZJ-118 TaxID=2709398 RepID=UPI0013EA5DFD|nr:hypothetical protein [Parabacteroides sp. ZJ-118]